MSATEYLRHPAILLAAVSVAIALAWFALGFPVEMPRSPLAAGEKLDCLAYAPARPGSTAADATIPAANIEGDLARLAPQTSCIRTYTTGMGLDQVPPIARRLGLTVLQGIAIGRDAERNRAEIERAIVLARTDRAGIRAFVVGSEVLSRGDLAVTDLGVLVTRVREATKLPVTYADRWETWLDAGGLAALVDFITIHVELYRADDPVLASAAARTMLDARAKVAARFAAKQVTIGEIGWPSAGRMREAALPSPANQARVIHDVVTAARSGSIRINIFEGYDQPWRVSREGTAGGHWGLIDTETGANKFRWGREVSNHPLWFVQGVLGIMLALIAFAAGYLAARSMGPSGPAAAEWQPVALVALAGGLFLGWAVADVPLRSHSILEWAHSILLVGLAVAMPPVAAAALIRNVPFAGFGALLNPLQRSAARPLSQLVALLFVLTVLVAIQLALGLVFDPANRDFLFAPLTGPAVALLVLAIRNSANARRDGPAEQAAALILAASALFIAFNETFWNWEALWFAATLLALALACWRPRVARNP
ncbi:MAG: beta-1,6-glucan synthase [Xanthobacteraceae bacterium]